MAHQLFSLPKQTAISANLTLLPGAKVEFFLTTTTTPTPVYTTSALSTPHANPVVADSAGRLPAIYLDPSIVYRITFKDSAGAEIYPAVDPVNDQLLSQAIIGGYLYPRTQPEIDALVTPVNYAFAPEPQANAFRYIDPVQVALISAGDATTQTAATVTTGLQSALTTYHNHLWPRGNYKINAALKIRPWSHLSGSGKTDYVFALNEAVTGTRIIQSAADFCISTDIGPTADASTAGNITIENLTVLGGIVSAPIGTYGIRIDSSDQVVLRRVQASFFTLSGFKVGGSLLAHLYDCEGTYNQAYGLNLDYAAHGTTETTNAYIAKIEGGKYTQNKEGGILVGVSSVRVSIWGIDCESNGRFYPTGAGFGVCLIGEARAVDIDGCWFEDNKQHIVVGESVSAPSLVTIPQAVRISSCEFGGINGAGYAIYFSTGRELTVENNEFAAGSKIFISNFVDNPVFRNNNGDPLVVDEDVTPITVGCQDMTNNWPYTDISAWTLTNCTVAEEFVESPAGPVPVYKVTPSATGLVQLDSPAAVYSFLMKRQTLGCYMRSDGTAARSFWPLVASVGIAKYYTAQEVDIWTVDAKWKWLSIGRKVATTDSGNQQISLVVTVTTTDPFYLTGFSSRTGICYEPWRVPAGGLPALANSAGPVVYGLSAARSGGTTTITNLVGGGLGQVFTLVAEHSLTITDGTNIFLAGSTNFAMNATDTLTVIRKSDGKWYEISRSDNT